MTRDAVSYDFLQVCLATQTLVAFRDGTPFKRYRVSTASRGSGQKMGSEQTPLGEHVVRLKIGTGEPRAAVFVGRRATGEVWSPSLTRQFPERDWVLSRILWLDGCVRGVNRRGDVDTLRRYIYIHGTPDHEPMGVAASHGCIRMTNDDVIELFDRVERGTRVDIVEDAAA